MTGAAVAVGVMLPLQAWAARVVNRGVPQSLRDRVQVRVRWAEILREPGFVALAAFFALTNLGHWMQVNHQRPILDSLDIPSAIAVAAAAAIGPAQVLGRLALMGQDKKVVDGKLRFILARGIGQAFVADDAPGDLVTAVLTDALRGRS
jgi:hypothetical protein